MGSCDSLLLYTSNRNIKAADLQTHPLPIAYPFPSGGNTELRAAFFKTRGKSPNSESHLPHVGGSGSSARVRLLPDGALSGQIPSNGNITGQAHG